jgi:hypothetical protein
LTGAVVNSTSGKNACGDGGVPAPECIPKSLPPIPLLATDFFRHFFYNGGWVIAGPRLDYFEDFQDGYCGTTQGSFEKPR